MLIQNSIVDPIALANSSATAGSTSTATTTGSGNVTNLANENTFLQLMVAQLKNQDPLQPTDGAQFLGQLAQFSQLEQLLGIRQDLESKTTQTSTTGTGAATGTTAS